MLSHFAYKIMRLSCVCKVKFVNLTSFWSRYPSRNRTICI